MECRIRRVVRLPSGSQDAEFFAQADDQNLSVAYGTGSAHGEVQLALKADGWMGSVFAPDCPRMEDGVLVERSWRGVSSTIASTTRWAGPSASHPITQHPQPQLWKWVSDASARSNRASARATAASSSTSTQMVARFVGMTTSWVPGP
jgi:hypothetical protein